METRKELIEHMERGTRVLEDKALKDAFEKIDRICFLEDDYKSEAYEDYALPIGHDQTNSQPTTVAFMLEKLDIQVGDKILEVGSGSGWAAALLGKLVGEKGSVIGVELIPELVERAKANIAKCDVDNVTILQAKEKELGNKAQAPYDKILVSAAATELPKKLVDQLAPGGIMVIPIIDEIHVIKKDQNGDIDNQYFRGFSFVPLII